jgi:hypothetical protein
LADANKQEVKVVLTLLSLPGDRWKQLNGNRNDDRIWRNQHYQQQAIQFWKDLALLLSMNYCDYLMWLYSLNRIVSSNKSDLLMTNFHNKMPPFFVS